MDCTISTGPEVKKRLGTLYEASRHNQARRRLQKGLRRRMVDVEYKRASSKVHMKQRVVGKQKH